MTEPEYDETDMTPEEFEARMARARPVDVSEVAGTTVVFCTGAERGVSTGSTGSTRSEQVRFAGNQTIRGTLVLAGT